MYFGKVHVSSSWDGPSEVLFSQISMFANSEADGEVFPGVVEEKEVARKKFANATKRGRTAGTVVQR